MNKETVTVFFEKALALKKEYDLLPNDEKREIDRLMKEEEMAKRTKIYGADIIPPLTKGEIVK